MIFICGNDFNLKNSAVCLGKFDGVHIGHRLLLDAICKETGLNSVMFTFDLHPYELFDKNFRCIYTNVEKKALLSKTELGTLIAYPFTKDTANIRAVDFVKDILIDKLDAKLICVGKDYRFGKGREGDVALLAELSSKYGFKLCAFDKVVYDNEEVSSTRIRNEIELGNVDYASKMLGDTFFIKGTVVHGNALGRTVGMPTANIRLPQEKIIPRLGVYASDSVVNGKIYRGITNIGVRPSITSHSDVGVETYLFDFNEDIYDADMEVKLLKFIRPEIKMNSLAEVAEQVKKDSEFARCL